MNRETRELFGSGCPTNLLIYDPPDVIHNTLRCIRMEGERDGAGYA